MIRTLVTALQCLFLCAFLILPYAHPANLRGVFASVLFFSRTAAFGHLDVQEDRGLHASAPQWIYVHVFFTSVFMGSSFYEIGLGRNHPMTISVKEKRGTENVWG